MTRRAYRRDVARIERYANTASAFPDALRQAIANEEGRNAREGIAAYRAENPLPDTDVSDLTALPEPLTPWEAVVVVCAAAFITVWCFILLAGGIWLTLWLAKATGQLR